MTTASLSAPRSTHRRATAAAVAPHQPARRRRVDPTTCEREYAPDEIEFMQALERYKRAHGRMFPTCSEILEVVKSLGYAR